MGNDREYGGVVMNNRKYLSFILNNKPVIVIIEPQTMLLDLLRDVLGLTGTKGGVERENAAPVRLLLMGQRSIFAVSPPESRKLPCLNVEG